MNVPPLARFPFVRVYGARRIIHLAAEGDKQSDYQVPQGEDVGPRSRCGRRDGGREGHQRGRAQGTYNYARRRQP